MRLLISVRRYLLFHLTPQRIFVLSFLILILAGAFLLWAPFSAGNRYLTFVDALFTSVSAVCVTGLTVIDIGTDLSFTGQIITMILFQCGGLGIITFSVFFFHLMGISISFTGREVIQSSFLPSPQRDFQVILKYVLISTLIIESIGAAILVPRFSQDFPIKKAIYLSIYHAISAFNNCGYALFPDSFIGYQGDIIINITLMALIVLGGIGFAVQFEVISFFKKTKKRLSLHAKIVLITTAILILSGAVLFFFFENNFIIKDAPWHKKILISLFQSITARTAGFNTVDIGLLTNDTILVLMILMFIGASPGSAGGGVKTTSLAVLFIMLWNRIKGHEEVNIMNRTIPNELVSRVIYIIFASVFSIAIITSLMLFAGGRVQPLASRHLFIEYLFDTISAFATAGLSMGITPHLNNPQKIILSILMFAGRVGPLTLAFSLSMKPKKLAIRYAEENIMVG
ncbi:MAG TPA: potassium transporter TrkG [Syntrophorhabdaceae bacterium]|nr:potassium transporter TrkG [Syntrophorhabdaceae bacterium]HOL05982.1 potassium transporter TrkG [Syntrophorhabdaceae bacterium]HPP42398.1 potassium transporter TrkG [Syntrophorhabdaceae bacterium]